jgi:phosphoribosylanthranilate isomerase
MIRVKICGITREEDAVLAARLGASAIGFIFYRGSRRYIPPAQAAAIARALPPFISTVGVFVDPSPEEVDSVLQVVPLSWIQLHGSEPPEFCARLGCPVIKAFRAGPGFDVNQLAAYNVGTFLLDGFDPRQPGGTGKTFDWRLARAARKYGSIVVAGGITAENVAQAAEIAQPDAVDVSSGVEVEPGKKDPEKLRRFFDVVHRINQRSHEPA